MIFNSAIFLVFITIFFAFWPIARKRNNSRWIYITLASFAFYGWWDWRFLFLLIFSGLVDYFSALAMESKPLHKKLFLYLSLTGNLGSLFIFKYSGFAAHQLDLLLSLAGIQSHLYNHIPPFALILPIGISFYTFQSLNYTIDVYNERIKATRNIFHFLAYLSLFPHLVAGPILRAREMLPQMMELHIPGEEEMWQGMKLIATGFFMKMVIADNLAPVVNETFNNPVHSATALSTWMAVILFAFQIYYDFSGYSNIAIGLLRWMGYSVPPNFNHPYASTSLQEFWQRWHISLMTWFNDYVFTPFIIAKRDWGNTAVICGIFLTFGLSGLWHGAAWTFIIWGLLHAFGISFEFVTKKFRSNLSKKMAAPIFKAAARVATLSFVLFGYIFFRSADCQQAFAMLSTMFHPQAASPPGTFIKYLPLLALALLPELAYWFGPGIKNKVAPAVYRCAEVAGVIALLVLCIYLRGPGFQFIYFQF